MKKNAIEMTKKFAKAAAKFGSPEYKQLQEARRDNPTFSVVTVTRKTTTKKNTYKGLTYEYMEMYIEKHDDEDKSIMAEYLMLRGMTDEAEEALAESFSYLEMKDWFLAKFPAIKSFHEARAKLLEVKPKSEEEETPAADTAEQNEAA